MSFSLDKWPKLYRGVLFVLIFVVSYNLLIKHIFEDLHDIIGTVTGHELEHREIAVRFQVRKDVPLFSTAIRQVLKLNRLIRWLPRTLSRGVEATGGLL